MLRSLRPLGSVMSMILCLPSWSYSSKFTTNLCYLNSMRSNNYYLRVPCDALSDNRIIKKNLPAFSHITGSLTKDFMFMKRSKFEFMHM